MAVTEDTAFGRRFIEDLIAEDARLTPELVSLSERFSDPFVSVDYFIEKWWAIPIKMYWDGRFTGERFGGPLWKRKSALASRGMINHGLVDVKGEKHSSTLWFECRWSKDVDFLHLFKNWVGLAQPCMGMLHVFTDVERAALKGNPEEIGFTVGTFGGPAKPGIPDMGWAMAYGLEHAEEVDVARITEAGFKVSEIGGGKVVQVTDSLADVLDDYGHFSRRRAELKSLFRPDLFRIK